jgi:hypothetical protein
MLFCMVRKQSARWKSGNALPWERERIPIADRSLLTKP